MRNKLCLLQGNLWKPVQINIEYNILTANYERYALKTVSIIVQNSFNKLMHSYSFLRKVNTCV